MAKSKAPAIQEIEKQLKQKRLLPVYYLFGEDSYFVDIIFTQIEKAVQPLITSDFDKLPQILIKKFCMVKIKTLQTLLD